MKLSLNARLALSVFSIPLIIGSHECAWGSFDPENPILATGKRGRAEDPQDGPKNADDPASMKMEKTDADQPETQHITEAMAHEILLSWSTPETTTGRVAFDAEDFPSDDVQKLKNTLTGYPLDRFQVLRKWIEADPSYFWSPIMVKTTNELLSIFRKLPLEAFKKVTESLPHFVDVERLDQWRPEFI